jgi:hypothetical protein
MDESIRAPSKVGDQVAVGSIRVTGESFGANFKFFLHIASVGWSRYAIESGVSTMLFETSVCNGTAWPAGSRVGSDDWRMHDRYGRIPANGPLCTLVSRREGKSDCLS